MVVRPGPDGMALPDLDVAYGGARHEFLVVFAQGPRVFARTMTLGGRLGPKVAVSTRRGGRAPAVAYHPGRDEYLVVWEQPSGPGVAVVARRLGPDGTPLGSREVPLSDRLDVNVQPDVVAAPSVGYLAVWVSIDPIDESDSVLDVVGRRVTVTGAPVGAAEAGSPST